MGNRSRTTSWWSRNALWAGLVAVVAVAAAALVLLPDSEEASGAGGLTGGDFHSLVVDPADPDRVLVGGHQAVSVSLDGGSSWQEVASLRDADAMGWAFTDEAVYVSGHPGLNRSVDGGATFERINEGLPNTDVHAFGGSGDVLYGATPATGVFGSTTGPGAWEPLSTVAGQSFFGRIIVDPDDPNHLIAADARAGVAESTDGGRMWNLLDTGLPMATWVSRGGEGLEVLVASGPAGAVLSTDQGATWEPLELPEGATLVEAVPGDAQHLYAGVHEGSRVEVLESTDGGLTWTSPSSP